MPLVEQTKQEREKLRSVSVDGLRNETDKMQAIINEDLRPSDDQLAGLHKHIAEQADLNINDMETIFAQIDKLEEDRNKQLEKVLMTVLPKAFAIVRETARRFKENEFLEVTARSYDISMAATKDNV